MQQREPDLLYEELDPINKAIVLKHYELSGAIRKWEKIISFLIQQMHHKKGKLKRTKFHIEDPTTKYYYDKFLFHGGTERSSLNPYPCRFRSELDNALMRSATNRFNYVDVYYNETKIPDELRFDTPDEGEWLLSEGLTMNQEDIAIMIKYSTQFINHVDHCLSVARTHIDMKAYNRLKSTRNRIAKAMSINPI